MILSQAHILTKALYLRKLSSSPSELIRRALAISYQGVKDYSGEPLTVFN